MTPTLLKELRDIAGKIERERADALQAKVRALESRVRTLERQRDNATGRCKELREHVTRYQRELAEERQRTRRGLPPTQPVTLEKAWHG